MFSLVFSIISCSGVTWLTRHFSLEWPPNIRSVTSRPHIAPCYYQHRCIIQSTSGTSQPFRNQPFQFSYWPHSPLANVATWINLSQLFLVFSSAYLQVNIHALARFFLFCPENWNLNKQERQQSPAFSTPYTLFDTSKSLQVGLCSIVSLFNVLPDQLSTKKGFFINWEWQQLGNLWFVSHNLIRRGHAVKQNDPYTCHDLSQLADGWPPIAVNIPDQATECANYWLFPPV